MSKAGELACAMMGTAAMTDVNATSLGDNAPKSGAARQMKRVNVAQRPAVWYNINKLRSIKEIMKL